MANPQPVGAVKRRDSEMSATGELNRGEAKKSNFDSGLEPTRCSLKDFFFQALLKSDLTDIKFIVGDEKDDHVAHKIVLILSSPVFRAQFLGEFSDSTASEIRIEDIRSPVFRHFIWYIYTNEFCKETSLEVTDLLDILGVADKYLMPALKKKCSELVHRNFHVNNIIRVIEAAKKYGTVNLSNACEDFIDRHAKDVFKSDRFKDIDRTLLGEFLSRDSMNISEYRVYKAVIAWADAECKRQLILPTSISMRSVLGDNLYRIRFPTMKSSRFGIVSEKELLTGDERIDIFRYIIGPPCQKYGIKEVAGFSTSKRVFSRRLYHLNRFDMKHVGDIRTMELDGTLYRQSVRFSIDRTVYFEGVRIFNIEKCGCAPESPGNFKARLEAHEHSKKPKTLYKVLEIGNGSTAQPPPRRVVRTSSTSHDYLHVVLDKSLKIVPGKMYTVTVEVEVQNTNGVPITFKYLSGEGKERSSIACTIHDFEFTFKFYDLGAPCKQIPTLMFSL